MAAFGFPLLVLLQTMAAVSHGLLRGALPSRRAVPLVRATRPAWVARAAVRRGLHHKSFADTPLGQNGTHLLAGLDRYSVPASGDRHPLAVYGIGSEHPVDIAEDPDLHPILLLHGRTWSSVPVFHLHLDAMSNRKHNEESRSLMEALRTKGTVVWCGSRHR